MEEDVRPSLYQVWLGEQVWLGTGELGHTMVEERGCVGTQVGERAHRQACGRTSG